MCIFWTGRTEASRYFKFNWINYCIYLTGFEIWNLHFQWRFRPHTIDILGIHAQRESVILIFKSKNLCSLISYLYVVYRLLSINSTSEICSIKPNLDCNYTFLIDLAPNGIIFDVRSYVVHKIYNPHYTHNYYFFKCFSNNNGFSIRILR